MRHSPSPNQLIQAVTTTQTGFIDPQVDKTVVWQGTDTNELSLEFPPSDIWGADPLGCKQLEDGFIQIRTHFEKQLDDGSWEEIDDPRRRVTPMTEIEQAIDQENRRLFPGDYATDDECDRCGGYGCEECDSPYNEPRYYCDSCRDQGCSLCSYGCESCQDDGCERCQPEHYCMTCSRYMASATDTGLCAACTDDLKPRCYDCGATLSDEENELCGSCQQYYDDMSKNWCSLCGKELSDSEQDLCTACNEYERELDALYDQEYEDSLGISENSRFQRVLSKIKRISNWFYRHIMS